MRTSCENRISRLIVDVVDKLNQFSHESVYFLKTTLSSRITNIWTAIYTVCVSVNSVSSPSRQGCGLGRDVSVSRRSRDVLTSRLGLVSEKILNVLVSSGSRSIMSRSRPSRSRFGSRAIASRRDILCRRTPCIL